MTDCQFIQNKPPPPYVSYQNEGTIYFEGNMLLINRSLFRDNLNADGSAVVISGNSVWDNCFVMINKIIIESNEAASSAAGLWIDDNHLPILLSILNSHCLYNKARSIVYFFFIFKLKQLKKLEFAWFSNYRMPTAGFGLITV